MKKKFSFIVLLFALLAPVTACSQEQSEPFLPISNVFPTSTSYEKTVYSVKYVNYRDKDGKLLADGKGKIVNDEDLSSLTVEYRKDGNYAKLTTDLKVVYNAALNDGAYKGATDIMRSEVYFDAAAGGGFPNRPLWVKKTMNYGRERKNTSEPGNFKEDGYSYDFTYSAPDGNGKLQYVGEGTYKLHKWEYDEETGEYVPPHDKKGNPIGGTISFGKKPQKKLAGVYDNEQLFYLLTAATYRVHVEKISPAIKSFFKIYNIYDNLVFGGGVTTMNFNIAENAGGETNLTNRLQGHKKPFQKKDGYDPDKDTEFEFDDVKIAGSGSNIAPVTAGLISGGMGGGFKGGYIEAYYSITNNAVTVGGGDDSSSFAFAHCRMLGYRQGITDSNGNPLLGVCYSLNEYGAN